MRRLCGPLFIFTGLLHFRIPKVYARIVPPYIPAPMAMVYASGVAEIAGGVGLMVPRWRRAGGRRKFVWASVAFTAASDTSASRLAAPSPLTRRLRRAARGVADGAVRSPLSIGTPPWGACWAKPMPLTAEARPVTTVAP